MQLDRWPSGSTDPVLPTGQRSIVHLRRALLAELRRAPAGTPITADLLAARVGWRYPAWPSEQTGLAAQHLVDEATVLGVLALGRTSQLLDAAEDPGFPAPTHQFVLQADLTAMPIGRDGTSRRFTPASIRRGLDHGLSSEQIVDWLTSHSLTPLPQPLAYLVGDVARQHGQIKVMPAAAVITIEDPAVLEALLRSADAGTLGLSKVGPQAVAAQGDVAEVVEALRAMGHAPVAQSAEGELLQAPRPRRAIHAGPPVAEPEPAVRPHHNEVDVVLAGVGEDVERRRRVRRGDLLDVAGAARQLVPQRQPEVARHVVRRHENVVGEAERDPGHVDDPEPGTIAGSERGGGCVGPLGAGGPVGRDEDRANLEHGGGGETVSGWRR